MDKELQLCVDKMSFYATKKEWQGLTDDEIQNFWYKLYPLDNNNLWADIFEGKHLIKFARAIEQALRIKNGT